MVNKELIFKLNKIPHKTGIYLWKNKHDEIIYIGKAKDLFNRTHQYLNKTEYRTKKIIDESYDIDFIVVNNEKESLLLENSLIKKHQPKFNILLKNGSGYPYIVVTKETHPRILYTTEFKKNKGTYYGPFPTMHGGRYDLYKLLLEIFPLRKCNILKKEKCLYYDIHQCLGPCVNKINIDQYQKILKQINDFFKGNNKTLINNLIENEKQATKNFDFELASKYYNLINAVKSISVKQNIQLKNSKAIDFVGYFVKNNNISIVIFSYANGELLTKHSIIGELNGDIDEIVESYLIQYYLESENKPHKCCVSLSKQSLKQLSLVNDICFINPIKSKYKTILLNAVHNAKQSYNSNYLIYKNKQSRTIKAFNEFQNIINLNNLSLIHAFDISSTINGIKVGGMIALTNGEFTKHLYRKFIIRDLEASSDSEYMYEVAKRQYAKMIHEKQQLPNLIIVDGGIIQINAVKKALHELKLNNLIPIIGLVKNNSHKTDHIIFEDKKTIQIDKHSSLYFFLSNIQEEVHRFVITFFKNKTKDSYLKNKLMKVKGVGRKTSEKIINHFGDIQAIKNATTSELQQYVDNKLAKEIKKGVN
jgi:excinuclease ABC subunit C